MNEPELTPEDWKDLKEGIILFNEEKFFEAHEALEKIWRRHQDKWRKFIQGLIQLAAAYHQLKENKDAGSNLKKALRNLEIFPDTFLIFDNQKICRQIKTCLKAMELSKDQKEPFSGEDFFFKIYLIREI